MTELVERIAQNFVVEYVESLSRFLVWTDSKFLGFRPDRFSAAELAQEQPHDTPVYIWDPAASADDEAAFCMVAGVRGRVSPLPSQICQAGLALARGFLADNVAAKRNVMVRTRAELTQKYRGNMPPLDSPAHPDRGLWDLVEKDFENAKAWFARFLARHP